MKVISANTGKATAVNWRGKQVYTGIYKYPVATPILLEKEDVANDMVVDRKVHGGADKACYLFMAREYAYWKEIYPELDWNWGMFGENLTIEGLTDSEICIGDIIEIGTALVQVTQPRQPCFKLGIRFNDQKILKRFIERASPGAYVRVLKPGLVRSGDQLKIERDPDGISLKKVFEQLYLYDDSDFVTRAIAHPSLADSCRNDLKLVVTRSLRNTNSL